MTGFYMMATLAFNELRFTNDSWKINKNKKTNFEPHLNFIVPYRENCRDTGLTSRFAEYHVIIKRKKSKYKVAKTTQYANQH